MALPRLFRSPFRKQPPQTDQAFAAWLSTPLGTTLLNAEKDLLDDILPGLVGVRALQVSAGAPGDLLRKCAMPFRWQSGPARCDDISLCARACALPVARQSLDLLLLHHSLDFDDQPHLVLREAVQSLRPGGHIVVVGFQPLGLWGLVRLFRLASGKVPWLARFLRPHRVNDWLHVLDCQVEGFESSLYGLPTQRMAQSVSEGRVYWLQSLGERFWSQHGAFYVLVARRRAAMIRPLKERFRLRDNVPNVIPVPVARWHQRDTQEPS